MLAQTVSELRGSGRLTGALQAYQHDDVRNAGSEHQLGVCAAKQAREFVKHHLHDVLCRRERVHDLRFQAALLRARDEGFHDLEVDVGLQKRHADFAHSGIDVFFRQLAFTAQARKNVLQTVGKVLEH